MANESYSAMKKRHQEKMDGGLAQTTFFAFSDKQFNEAMKKFGLNRTTINTSFRINSGHVTNSVNAAGAISRHHTARFSAR